MTESLAQCEHEVQGARAKLTADLTTLRSPATLTAFTDGLKHEAFAAKDSVVQHAKNALQAGLEGLADELKAKAAANPAAALTIGAGIAWQLIRNPPIATALIGAGLFSLWRTQTSWTGRRSNSAYLDQGKHRLKEQMNEVGSKAVGVATNVGEALSEKTAHLYDAARETMHDWSNDAAGTAAVAASALKAGADGLAASAHRTFHDALDQVEGSITRPASTAKTAVSETSLSAHDTTRSPRAMIPASRDTLLLGIAGAAVAAAVGIAFQKRISGRAAGALAGGKRGRRGVLFRETFAKQIPNRETIRR
jgi:hypothetical protein